MKFLRKSKKTKKVILVISDLHLGAGDEVDGRQNHLEDFFSDKELVDFLHYYSMGEYQNKEVELVINGDFLDLLAVPFVPHFDDNYWSEKAALQKIELILKAHPEVIKALVSFLEQKNKTLVYIIGNHDAELLFDSLKERFKSIFPEEIRNRVTISNDITLYEPVPGVFIQHGHEYESLHHFSEETCIAESSEGEKYFIPPWGSYYVTHVINKYKQEREHINAVRPIKKFIMHALIFDTFFALRFIIANGYFYFMIRFLRYYRLKLGWRRIIEDIVTELTLFQDYEGLTRKFFDDNKDAKVLIVGHTHEPIYREYSDGTKFINTGTWTRMVNLDLSHDLNDTPLTYAKVEIFDSPKETKPTKKIIKRNTKVSQQPKKDIPEKDKWAINVRLNKWVPKTDLPYEEFR